MSFAQQGFYTGYLCKTAEDTEEAGLPWAVRHPFLNALRGGAAGAVGGTAAGIGTGAVAGGLYGRYGRGSSWEGAKDWSAAGGVVGGGVGLPLGTVVGIALAMHRAAARVREIDHRLVRSV